MTVTEARQFGTAQLSQHSESQDRSRADATLLLMYALRCSRAEILSQPDRILQLDEEQRYRRFLAERASGKPIQYITGQQEFWGLPFLVTPDVLIPRPETEHLVEAAIARLQAYPTPRIVDVGTGSGAIAVALAHALPRAQLTAIDISAAALAVAQENAVRNGVAGRIQWLQCDLLSGVLPEQFDAVISNPPYVADADRVSLATEVRDHEPSTALFAGPTGLEIYERLIPQAALMLVPGGWLLMEIGYGQQPALQHLLSGWPHVFFIDDLQNIPRVVCAQPSSNPLL